MPVSQGRQRFSSEFYDEDHEFFFVSFDLELVPPPFADGPFDVVLFYEILEHLVIDPLAIFPRLYRLQSVGATTENRGDNLYVRARRPSGEKG